MPGPFALDKAAAHFRKGARRLYLPNFTVTLIRSPALPPTFAKFVVPLNFNKLDIRDYLFHAYNVRVLRIRSFITQSKVEVNEKGQKFRRRGVKKMTVEMTEPFVWPEEPENFEKWDKETKDAAEEYNEKQNRHLSIGEFGRKVEAPPKQHREALAEQAKALLSGKDKWAPTWKTLGQKRDVVVDSAGSAGRNFGR